MLKYFDPGTIVVITVTFLLFAAALFVKGFTQDLLLEAGVFLVSTKLILMAYRNTINYKDIKKDLEEIKSLLREKN